MDNRYRCTKTTVSLIHYHFVFCPRYRRRIFAIPGVEARFRELVKQVCDRHDMVLCVLDCGLDYVYLSVRVLPQMSASEVMLRIKSGTSLLLEEFSSLSAMPNLWTRNFFVSTEAAVDRALVEEYVNTQKTRP